MRFRFSKKVQIRIIDQIQSIKNIYVKKSHQNSDCIFFKRKNWFYNYTTKIYNFSKARKWSRIRVCIEMWNFNLSNIWNLKKAQKTNPCLRHARMVASPLSSSESQIPMAAEKSLVKENTRRRAHSLNGSENRSRIKTFEYSYHNNAITKLWNPRFSKKQYVKFSSWSKWVFFVKSFFLWMK